MYIKVEDVCERLYFPKNGLLESCYSLSGGGLFPSSGTWVNSVTASTMRMRRSDALWLLGLHTKWPYSFCLGCALSGCLPLEPGHHGSMVLSIFRVVRTSPLFNSTFPSPRKETLYHSLSSFSLPWQPLICFFLVFFLSLWICLF